MSLVIFCLPFSFVDYVPVKGEIIWYLSLTAWLISLSIVLSSSIHAVAKGRSSFFLLLQHSIPLCKCTIIFLIHSFTDGYLGCFQHLAIGNCAAMTIGVHRFFRIGVSGFLGYNPSSGIAGQKAVPFLVF